MLLGIFNFSEKYLPVVFDEAGDYFQTSTSRQYLIIAPL